MSSEDLGSLVERASRLHGELPCLSFGDGTTMTFVQVAQAVARMRGVLLARGIRPGDRVAIMMSNSLFYPTAWLGIVSLGATAVPVNSRSGPDDAAYIVRHSGARLVVCDSVAAPIVERVRAGTDRPVAILEVGAGHLPAVAQASSQAPPEPSRWRALANIQYTSGTTGFPKGCLLTHAFWHRMGQAAADLLRLAPDQRLLCAQPFSYIDPPWNVVASLLSGAHLILLDGFHPTTFMREVARWRVTTFYCLGVMPTLLLKQPPGPWDRDHTLERVACSAIPPQLHRQIQERWGVPWFEVFGMTETGINIAVPEEDRDWAVGTGCIGRPLPHCEVSVAGEDGAEAPPGDVGELRLRGQGFMEGYLEDPEATARFFRNGWANTGDLVRQDERGLLYFCGRIKEFVRRGGENISEAEVEFALHSHDDVLDCAVAPVPDEVMGEEAKAYVVLLPGRPRDAEALRSFLLSKLAVFKVPRYWEFREDLPRTPSERIAKKRLEEGTATWRKNTYDGTIGRVLDS